MGKLHKVSLVDLFAQPIRLKTRHTDGTMSYYYGSWFGIALTFLGLSILFGYLAFLTLEMYQNKLDTTNLTELRTSQNNVNLLKMKEFNFMPSIEMHL